MIRFSLSRAWLLGPLFSLSATSCVDDESTLFIKGVIHLQAPTCVAEADPTAVFLGAGTLDYELFQPGEARSYYAVLLVGNQFTPRGDKNRNRTETSWVTLRGAEVSLSTGESFSVAGSGSVAPNTSADPGWGLFGAVIIPNAADVPEIDAHIKVFGVTTGGEDITSGEFVFPVHVCHKCLISYPLKAIDPAAGTCTLPSDDTPALPCIAGQDDFVDCRSCSGIPACLTP